MKCDLRIFTFAILVAARSLDGGMARDKKAPSARRLAITLAWLAMSSRATAQHEARSFVLVHDEEDKLLARWLADTLQRDQRIIISTGTRALHTDAHRSRPLLRFVRARS